MSGSARQTLSTRVARYVKANPASAASGLRTSTAAAKTAALFKAINTRGDEPPTLEPEAPAEPPKVRPRRETSLGSGIRPGAPDIRHAPRRPMGPALDGGDEPSGEGGAGPPE